MRNKKRNKYAILILILLALSIGYAAISTTLKIDGSTGISKQSWSVYWANPVVTTGSVTTNIPTITQDTNYQLNTKAIWNTTLNLPGDFYEFTIDAVNDGSIDAMITNIETSVTDSNGDPATLPSYIKVSVTYDDGIPIRKNQLLAKKNGNTVTVDKYKVRVEFLDTITREELNAIPTGGLSYVYRFGVTYGQAVKGVKPHIITSYGVLPYGTTPFSADDWTIRGDAFGNADRGLVLLNNSMAADCFAVSKFSEKLTGDHSFYGRMTYTLEKSSDNRGGHMRLTIGNTLAATTTGTDNAINIALNLAAGANWRDENGEGPSGDPDGWNTGTPSGTGAPITVFLNNDTTYTYAVAYYPSLLDKTKLHEMWYNYDGTQKKFYVYMADYDENGHVTKPQQPLLTVPIYLDNVFDSSNEVYFKFYGRNGFYTLTYDIRGFNFTTESGLL